VLADLGNAPTFSDNLVEVEAADQDQARQDQVGQGRADETN
jgi:hypothetical protein